MSTSTGALTYYLTNFSQNCMKMKKFWLRGGCAPLAPQLHLPLTMCIPRTDYNVYILPKTCEVRREGNVFSHVCLSLSSWGGSLSHDALGQAGRRLLRSCRGDRLPLNQGSWGPLPLTKVGGLQSVNRNKVHGYQGCQVPPPPHHQRTRKSSCVKMHEAHHPLDNSEQIAIRPQCGQTKKLKI